MNYLIEEQTQLKELEPLISHVSEQSGVIAVDTEFLREKTYSAKLCLVQLGIGENQYCIDVLAIEDLSLIVDLFANEQVTKLFHAARQDMEVIYQTFGVMPKPIFDTQLAAAFCGFDMQLGYGALVLNHLEVDLPKSQSRTDWTRRPLTADQIEYAGDDVAYLEALYDIALKELNESGKYEWYCQEINSYYDPDLYVIDPAKAYQRLSGGGLKIAQQYTLKALAQWREEGAQKRNIPRTWMLRDDKLFDLAAQMPTTVGKIVEMGIFGKKSSKYLAPQAVKIIASVEVGEDRLWRKVEPLQKHEKKFCSTMMNQVKKIAEQHSIAQALLGTRRDVESLYRHRTSKKLLSGWREDVIGKPLLAFVDAELSDGGS